MIEIPSIFLDVNIFKSQHFSTLIQNADLVGTMKNMLLGNHNL